jgi:DHA1 family bicyclomycin/chloramphenicol resistance-like MFS transporter
VIGRAFDGTATPLAVGYLALSSGTLALVLWTERGRLVLRSSG